jgi:hypothetical protein
MKLRRMKKLLLSILLSLITALGSFAERNDRNWYFYTPDGREYLPLSENKILIRFADGLTFAQKAQILGKEVALKPLSEGMNLPSPKVTIAELASPIGQEKLLMLLSRLRAETSVEYANPFLVSKDDCLQGITEHLHVKLNTLAPTNFLNDFIKQHQLDS